MSRPTKSLRPQWNSLTQDEFRKAYREAASLADLALLLNLPAKQLAYYSHHIDKHGAYSTFSIPRKNHREREIEAPNRTLKYIQRVLHESLTKIYGPHAAVHGFCPDRSIVTNAKNHQMRKYVLNLDLADFFPSITKQRIFGRLVAEPYKLNAIVANVISSLTTNAYARLPQGSPSSPVLANMIAASLDNEIAGLCGPLGCRYTRYADDITISSNRGGFPPELARYPNARGTGQVVIGDKLTDAIEKHGFKINHEKSRLHSYWTRQLCTGIVVNGAKLTPPRSYVRRLRSLVDHWQKHGWENAATVLHEKEHRKLFGDRDELANHVYGRLGYLKMVRGSGDTICIQLQSLVDAIPAGH